jgi:hypothetical protein
MARREKRRRTESQRRRRVGAASGERIDPFEDVVEYGGELIFAIGVTPGGAPFGPRVEIADGELRFPDDERLDLDAEG